MSKVCVKYKWHFPFLVLYPHTVGCPVLAVLYWLTCSDCSVLAVLSLHTVLCWQSCFVWLVSPCPVLAFLSWLSHSSYLVLAVLFCLSFSDCALLSVLPWLSYPSSPLLAALSWHCSPDSFVLRVPFWLSCKKLPFFRSSPFCSALTVLS